MPEDERRSGKRRGSARETEMRGEEIRTEMMNGGGKMNEGETGSVTRSVKGNERRSGKNHVSGHGVANDPETSPAAETDRETSPVEESDQERNLEGQETDLGVETSLGVESDQETSLGDEIDPEKNLGVEIIGPEKSLEVEIDPDLVKDVIGTTEKGAQSPRRTALVETERPQRLPGKTRPRCRTQRVSSLHRCQPQVMLRPQGQGKRTTPP